MFSHSKPQEKSLKSLELDLENPRLIGYRKRINISSQKEIAIALAIRYDVLDLCRSILKSGFQPDEILIVIPSENSKRRFTAVEGNRRLSACKIIENPDILSNTAHKHFSQRIKKHPNYQAALETIKKLNVVILESRENAAAYLAAKHTRESIKGWSPYTQGAYYISLKQSDMSLSDLRELLNEQVTLTRMKEVILFYRVSDFFLELNCWSEEERNYLYSEIDNLKTEAITRLIKSNEFKRNIGKFYIDDNGDLITSGLTIEASENVFEKLARDSHFNKDPDSDSYLINTRQEDKEWISNYITDIAKSISDAERVDNETKINGELPEPKPNPETTNKPKPKPPTAKSNQKLLHDNVPLPKHMKLAEMCAEAKRMNSKLNVYSSALLARALMEITLKTRIKECGQETALRSLYKEKALNFESILSFFEKNVQTLVPGADSQKAMRGVISDIQTTNKDIMNLTNHNDLHLLSETHVSHIQSGLNTIALCLFPLIGDCNKIQS